jgi:high affinity Mn2+ porin
MSLQAHEGYATSLTSTVFLDFRLWESGSSFGELVFNPEIAGGRGFSGVNGIAGFSNGEITRVGAVEPTPYIARLYYRQTIGLGGEQEKIEDVVNQIQGKRDVDRITVTLGKLTFTDLVDDNKYSHDPRTQFLNWALMYNGAWDYPANVRGYSYGFGIDFNHRDWALRYGVMAEPAVANGGPIDPHFLEANGHLLEWEGRYEYDDHPGRIRLMSYLNHAHMGDYREALLAMPTNPDVTQTRSYRFKYGFGLNWEQELTKDLGLFGRLGWNDGRTESWAFTPIDRTASLGMLLNGRLWRRPKDQVGIAGALNGLSQDHRNYLAAGGLDFSIGDGRLNYELEEILEVFYDLELIKGVSIAADFQEINHPAYNRDRGPVSVGSLRVHLEF